MRDKSIPQEGCSEEPTEESHGYTRYKIEIDGRLQVTSALSLLELSKLIRWDSNSGHFTPISQEEFRRAHEAVDPVFGRLICWISFSAGAEFLAKGVCLLRGVEVREGEPKLVPDYPSGDLTAWVTAQSPPNSTATRPTTNFGQIGELYNKHLKNLCTTAGATVNEEKWLLAAYELLGKTIRNRDAHAYVPNVRDAHFDLVSELFTKCFDLLVKWLPGGATTVNEWRDPGESLRFIECLRSAAARDS